MLPRLNEDVNEEWISDKTRFADDGAEAAPARPADDQRDGRLQPADWHEALDVVAERLRAVPGERIAAIAGDLVDAETMFAAEGAAGRARLAQSRLPPGRRQARAAAAAPASCSTRTIAGIEQADVCLLVGTNPRWEAPLRQRAAAQALAAGRLQGGARSVPPLDLTYPVEMLGDGAADAAGAGRRRASASSTCCKSAKAPMMIVGPGALARPDGAAVLGARARLAEACGMVREDWNGFNVLHPRRRGSAASISASCRAPGGRTSPAFSTAAARARSRSSILLGADEVDPTRPGPGLRRSTRAITATAAPARADVVLPGAAYTEKHGTYVNIEGRVQRGRARGLPAGRRARGLDDPARAVRACWASALPFDPLRRAARGGSPSWRRSSAGIDIGDAGGLGAVRQAGPDRRARPFAIADHGLLPDQRRSAAPRPVMAECSGAGPSARSDAAATGTHG